MDQKDQITAEPMDEVFSAYQNEDGALVVDVPDPDTGEMIPTLLADLPAERALVGIGYAVKNALKERDQQLTILSEQIATLKMQISRVTETSERSVRFLKDRAGMTLLELDREGRATRDKQARPYFKIPNCGKFAVQVIGREGVDSILFDQMDDDQKAVVQNAHAEYFVITTRCDPDKRSILAALKRGTEIPGFGLHEATTGLVFKPEIGTGIGAEVERS